MFVDGVQVTLGARAAPDAEITLAKPAQRQQQNRITILLHKPIGYVSGQAEDGHRPATTLITAANQVPGDRPRWRAELLRGLAPQAAWISIPPASWCSPRTAASPAS